MSELKAYKMVDEKYCTDCVCVIPSAVYLKSEADKVIAEKDKVIEELNDKLQNVSELLTDARGWLIESQKMHKRCADNAIKQLRHQKYKRCLAMAKWCDTKADWYYGIGRSLRSRVDFFIKWRDKWLKIAEMFKEVK